jgi:hypothetical protein
MFATIKDVCIALAAVVVGVIWPIYIIKHARDTKKFYDERFPKQKPAE